MISSNSPPPFAGASPGLAGPAAAEGSAWAAAQSIAALSMAPNDAARAAEMDAAALATGEFFCIRLFSLKKGKQRLARDPLVIRRLNS
jgi:hypothetical protein